MKTIYDLAVDAGILKDKDKFEVHDFLDVTNVEKFARLIVNEFVGVVDEEYNPGDLSERNNSVRKVRNKLIRRFGNI
jgi:hypothetical protein